MAFPLWQDTKEQIKQSIDIVELVGRYVPLRRQGKLYVGLCPWHDDHRPSLQVNPDRQLYKCWVCNIGGDIFSFLMRIENLSFREALELLAEQAGVTLPRKSAWQQAQAEQKKDLYKVARWVEQQYHECLLSSPVAEPARNYLAERRIARETVDRFRLGFAPLDGSWILNRANRAAVPVKLLEAIGVVARAAGSGHAYDRFRGRLIFPIRDPQDRTVGFGGRLVPGVPLASQAKYVNSPETRLFAKSHLVYGLDVAKESVRRSGRILVMEGYTDCILAHQFGITNAVAVLGTALGHEHVRLLRRFAEQIVLVLDGDEAGRRRATEVLEIFAAHNVDLRVVTLPEGKDPADLLLESGPESLTALVENDAVDALEHARRAFTVGIDLKRDIQQATAALERILAIIAQSPPNKDETFRVREERMIARLALEFAVAEETIRRRLAQLRQGGKKTRTTAETQQQSPADPAPWQRELVEIILREPQLIARVVGQIEPVELEFEPLREIYKLCCNLWQQGKEPNFDQLLLWLDDPQLQAFLVELDESARKKHITPPQQALEEFLSTWNAHKARKVRSEKLVALKEGDLSEQEQINLLEQLVAQRQKLHGGSEPKDG